MSNLQVKEPHTIQVEEPQLELVDPVGSAELVSETEETLTHINPAIPSMTTCFARGYANLYVRVWGQKDSQGLMTNGDYQQIEAYKNVIDWLNGRCRPLQIIHANAKSKLIGLMERSQPPGSYLGTMSNGLATTGVDGLEVIIAEAGSLLGTTTTAKMVS